MYRDEVINEIFIFKFIIIRDCRCQRVIKTYM